MFWAVIFVFFLNLEAVPTDWILVRFRHISLHTPLNTVKPAKPLNDYVKVLSGSL